MGERGGVTARVEAAVLPVVTGEGMELVDVEFQREVRGWVLRLYVDKPGGITLRDCETVSEQVGDLLDVENLIDHPYTLEVSSPGLDRRLKRREDFRRFLGHRAHITTYAPIDGQRHFHGLLAEGGEAEVTVEQEGSRRTSIPYTAIAKAHLEGDLLFPKGRGKGTGHER